MKRKLWAFGILVLVLYSSLAVNVMSEDPPGWSDDTRLTSINDFSSLKPRIAIDSQDNMHIVYNDYRHGPPELYYMKLDSLGNVLVDEKGVTLPDTDTSNLGDIVCDSQDNIHVVWSDTRNSGQPVSNLEIYYKKLDNMGDTVVDDTRITVMPYYSVYPAIAVDSSDNLHIAWCEEMEFGSIWQEEILYTKLDNNGNTLVEDVALTESDGEESLFPDIAVDSAGNVHIMWIDDRNVTGTQQNQDYWYTKLDNDGNTVVDDTYIFFKGEHFRPSISIDSNDLLHLICGSFQGWKGNTYRQIYRVLLDNDGNIVDPEARLTNDDANASHPRSFFDSSEDLHLVWEDERHNNTEIYYMKLDIGGNIIVDELRLTDNISKSLTPQLALDSQDSINVVWADGRAYMDGDKVELYHKMRIDDTNDPPEVGITSPTPGETVSGEITISGWASDPDGSVERVEIKVFSDSWKSTQGTESWSYSWDTRSMENGHYMISVRSYDGMDYSIIRSINVEVNNTETPPPSNQPPTVSINPIYQAEVSGEVYLYGTASDPDGTVDRVQVRIDSGGWRTADNTGSWSFLWNTTGVSDGLHIIYARAIDNENEESTHDSITVTVNNTVNTAPSVNIISPVEGETVSGFVFITGSASDVDGQETLSSVQVRIQGEWYDVGETSSWSFIWDTLEMEDGEYEIAAQAFDGTLYSEIESVLVTVDNPHPPELTLLSDVPEKVSGTLELRGTSSDEDGDIERIEILIDSGEWTLITSSKDWSYELDTRELKNGAHTVTIRAVDDEGEMDLLIISIIVENEEDELSFEMIFLMIGIIIAIIAILIVAIAGRKKSKKAISHQPMIGGEPHFQILKCPMCSNVFQADPSHAVHCPNCGYSSNA
jgi:hypothetical protein